MSTKLTPAVRQFIKEHGGDNPERLLLGASRYPEIDIPFAVGQIVARRQIEDKLPSWFADDGLLFPSGMAAEQCSSEQTARYKQRLISRATCLCDLTGGLGVDSLSFSYKAQKVIYIERFAGYCEAARHNFTALGAGNIEIWQGDAASLPDRLPDIDVFYIDPARRGEGNKRVFALQDCEPDLTKLLPTLLEVAPKVIAKLSPMVDIRQTLEQLPGTREVHVLSVRNDCKEVLFVIGRSKVEQPLPVICINYTTEAKEEAFVFTLQQEKQLEVTYASEIQSYVYEPNVSLLKAGAFKSVTTLGVGKLHPHSHLYTSEQLIKTFPGRIFYAEEVLPFNNALCKTLRKTVSQANITTRNFPLTVEELRKRTKLKDGGNVYLFATTLSGERKVLIKCRKIIPTASGK
ncbi:MAG: class I SAM-dependent methyltransferase [Tannerellaceae bacterium]|nr:class I SAM-dependent methyltransferase [Tannerellaceae bacterium]